MLDRLIISLSIYILIIIIQILDSLIISINTIWTLQTQSGHFKHNLDTTNTIWTLQTQSGHYKHNMHTINTICTL